MRRFKLPVSRWGVFNTFTAQVAKDSNQSVLPGSHESGERNTARKTFKRIVVYIFVENQESEAIAIWLKNVWLKVVIDKTAV